MLFENQLIDMDTLERVAPVIRNAAHPLRLRILDYLHHEKEARTVTEITAAAGASQAIVSQQLRILKDQGLIAAKRESHNVLYCIVDPSVLLLLECIRRHEGMCIKPFNI